MSSTDPALTKQLPRLAVLISGSGTTLVNLQRRIALGELRACVAIVLASRNCTGIERARELGLPVQLIARREFADVNDYSQAIFDQCLQSQVDLVVLAGFLSKLFIPDEFRERVLNIHPSLIPAFCGQGMFGHHVHEAVLARGCQVSGCTVHFCDNDYDHGPIIAQQCVPVLDDDLPETLAARVFATECDLYPRVIERVLHGDFLVQGRRVLRRHSPPESR